MTKLNQFYVYMIRDPRPDKRKMPVYIGKGQGQRVTRHFIQGGCHNLRLERMIAQCRKLGLAVPHEIVARFADEADALDFEKTKIAQYGRRDRGSGTLYNLTDGGDGVSGWIPSHTFAKARDKRGAERFRRLHTDPQFAKARNKRAAAQFRKINADPKNLKAAGQRGAKVLRKLWRDPEYAKGKSDWMRKLATTQHANPEFAKGISDRARKLHADPEFAKKWSEINSKRARKRNLDPEFQALCKIGRDRYWIKYRRMRDDAKRRQTK